MPLGSFKASVLRKIYVRKCTFFPKKRLTQFRLGEAFFRNVVDFRKLIFCDTESLNKSQGLDLARFSILLFLRLTPAAIHLDLKRSFMSLGPLVSILQEFFCQKIFFRFFHQKCKFFKLLNSFFEHYYS